VERNCSGILTWIALVVDFKSLRVVVPDVNVALRASNNELFAQANIHTSDCSAVESGVKGLQDGNLLSHRSFTLVAEPDRQELVVLIDTENLIFWL
jgi:hypothetical protein